MHHNTTHGLSLTRAYKSWQNARLRCTNPANKDFKHYGERGLGMESDWCKDFQAFFDDLGECPAGYTLERIDVNKGYVRGNCTWIPKSKQNLNKRNSRNIEYLGETKTLAEWSEHFGIDQRKTQERLTAGWPLDRVFSTENHSIRTILTCNGISKCIMDWSRELGIGESAIRRRLKLGWPVEAALLKPVNSGRLPC